MFGAWLAMGIDSVKWGGRAVEFHPACLRKISRWQALECGPIKCKVFGPIADFLPARRAPGEFILHSTLAGRRLDRNGFPHMTLLTFLGLIPALFGLAGDPPSQQRGVRRVVINQEMVISIPIRPRPRQTLEWNEHKGPKCIPVERIAGALWSGPSSIDFILRDRRRIRAVMDDECPALDFYKGFYLQPDDERICAKRESIQNRVGASCRIERFRRLVPQVKQVKR